MTGYYVITTTIIVLMIIMNVMVFLTYLELRKEDDQVKKVEGIVRTKIKAIFSWIKERSRKYGNHISRTDG